MTKTTAAILTILTDAAAQVDRARPADARNGPGWDGPGAEWWEDFTATVEQQLDAGDVAADATAQEQRDVAPEITIIQCGCGSHNKCDHDWGGWRPFEDGNGGEQVCKKCGLGAVAHSLSLDW